MDGFHPIESSSYVKEALPRKPDVDRRLAAGQSDGRSDDVDGLGDLPESNLPESDLPKNPAPGNRHPPNSDQRLRVESICWRLLKRFQTDDSLETQLQRLANDCAECLQFDFVIIAIRRKPNGPIRVAAVSGTSQFDANADVIRQFEQICEEHNGRGGEPLHWSAVDELLAQNQEDGEVRSVPAASDSFFADYACRNGFRTASLIPVVTSHNPNSFVQTASEALGDSKDVEPAGTTFGHLALFSRTTLEFSDHGKQLCSELMPAVARNVELKVRCEGNWMTRQWSRLHQQLFVDHRKAWLIGLAVLTLILCLPLPHHVTCESVLEPDFRRLIDSPVDGRLRDCLVEPGDAVAQSQVLAILDDSELKLKLQSANSELGRETERRDNALQLGNVADAQIAFFEIEKLQNNIEIYRQQLEKLTIRSPIDGIVVSGELDKVVGSTVKTGQPLFEVGPLDRFETELEIDEGDIRFIKPGQTVDVHFDAIPLSRFSGSISRVYPRAERRNESTAFIATVLIENPEQILRPGMKGTASIRTGPSTLGWNLLHRPIEKLRSCLGI